MTGTTVRRQSVLRRTLLAGTAGLLGGAALPGGAPAQNNAGGGAALRLRPEAFLVEAAGMSARS
jgi:hypothetical protein